MQANHRLTVSFSVLMILSLGCSFVTQLFSRQGSEKREVRPEPPTLPTPPKPASVAEGTPEEQAVSFADLLASGDSDTRLAGWMGVYDALGVPVIGQDGVPLGSTGDDPFGPRYWQLWYASGLDRTGRGIPLSDAGRLIAAGLPDVDGIALAQLLLDDLRVAAQSQDPQVRLMGWFVRERVLRGPSHLDILDSSVTPDAAVIDLPTVQLIGWALMRAGLFHAISQASLSARPALVDYQPGPQQKPPTQQRFALNCSDLPGAGSDAAYWTNWILNKLGGGFQLPGMQDAFKSVVERIVSKAWDTKGEKWQEHATNLAGKILGYASAITNALSFALQWAALEIRGVQDPDPLERTKYSTYPGKEGTIYLQLYSEPDNIPNGNELEACLSSFALNALGVSFSFPAKGFIPGAELTIKGGQGFPDLVLFDTRGTNSLRAWTNTTNGQASFNVFGAPQKRDLPDGAEPVDKEYSIFVSAQPEEAGLNTMLNIFFDGLSFGTAPSGSGAISSLVDMLKTFSFDMGEHVLRLKD